MNRAKQDSFAWLKVSYDIDVVWEKRKSFYIGILLGAISLFIGEVIYELLFDATVWLP